MDSLVLITPLVTLPIVLLFVFVGCALVLPIRGRGAPTFNYVGGLDLLLERLEWEFESNVTVDPAYPVGTIGGPSPDPPSPVRYELDAEQIEVNGGTVPDGILLIAHMGPVTCRCWVTRKGAPDPDPMLELTKNKVEYELPPDFTLERDGAGGFHLV